MIRTHCVVQLCKKKISSRVGWSMCRKCYKKHQGVSRVITGRVRKIGRTIKKVKSVVTKGKK